MNVTLQKELRRIVSGLSYNTYETKLEKEVLAGPVPKHVAVIMDGNRRYAKEALSSDIDAEHKKGEEKLEEVLDWCLKLNIRIMTVFAFSTENFERNDEEVDFLMDLIEATLFRFSDDERIHNNKIALRVIGDRSLIPEHVLQAIDYAENRTAGYSGFQLNVAVAYGGRQEIIKAVREIAQKVKEGSMEISDIDEQLISDSMYTFDLPDPELILRTSGELRVSNFLLWQLAYSEFYFSDVFWPGFRYVDFLRAIRAFQQRSRRFGQ